MSKNILSKPAQKDAMHLALIRKIGQDAYPDPDAPPPPPVDQTDYPARAAWIMAQLSPEKQRLAIAILEVFLAFEMGQTE